MKAWDALRGRGRGERRWSRTEAEARLERGEPVEGRLAEGADVAASVGAAGGAAPSRLSLFLRASVLDFLLVLCVSTALVLTASFAFESAPTLRGNVVLVAGVCSLVLVPLFAGAWSRRAVAPAAFATVVVCVGVVAAFAAAMPAGTPLFVDGQVNDVPENYVVFACVLVVVPVLSYLLSRRTAGLAFLLAATIAVCGSVEFLYRDWMAENGGLAVSVVAYVGVALLFVYQTYRRSVYAAQRARRTSFLGVFAFGALIVCACAGIAAALFYGVVAPLGLQTVDVKPFQDYYQRPVIEYTGVFDRQQVESQDDTTDDVNDQREQTGQDAQGADDQDSERGQASQGPLVGIAQAVQAFNPNSWSQQYSAVSYAQLRLGALIAVLASAAIVAAAILARRSVRERRLRRLSGASPSEQVRSLYEFLLGRFARLGVRKEASLTPMEFALGSQRAMQPYAQGTGGVDFVHVTDVYQRACYGGQEVSLEERDEVVRYYRAFFKNACRHVGKLRWAWKFWRI